MNPTITEWSKVPNGMCFVRLFHDEAKCKVLHPCLKLDDKPFEEQPKAPIYSNVFNREQFHQFWDWAVENWPIYEDAATVDKI